MQVSRSRKCANSSTRFTICRFLRRTRPSRSDGRSCFNSGGSSWLNRRRQEAARSAIRASVRGTIWLERIQTLWKTDEVRPAPPDVINEIKMGHYYFNEAVLEAVPHLYRRLEGALDRTYGEDADYKRFNLPTILRFGSWIGGDRDGNPNVTADITRRAFFLNQGDRYEGAPGEGQQTDLRAHPVTQLLHAVGGVHGEPRARMPRRFRSNRPTPPQNSSRKYTATSST